MMANDGIQFYIGWPTIRKIGQLDFIRKIRKSTLLGNPQIWVLMGALKIEETS